ncbi:hypothetical protein ACFYN3_02265 [Streptomyces lavendulae]|uniref:hypothetical protein n=1 Tax=Streptomyces lavendulae TaxID=1914 RepID=UPI0033F3F5B4
MADVDHGTGSAAISAPGTLVTLNSVEDGRYNDTLSNVPSAAMFSTPGAETAAPPRIDPPREQVRPHLTHVDLVLVRKHEKGDHGVTVSGGP